MLTRRSCRLVAAAGLVVVALVGESAAADGGGAGGGGHAAAAPVSVRLAVETSGGELVATLSFVNRSSKPQYLDKHMTCLDGTMRTRVFSVRSGRTELHYLLPMGKYPAPGPDDYVSLAPGARVATRVRLDQAFDFAPGRHRYRIRYSAFHGRPDESDIQQLQSNEVTISFTR